VVEKQIVAVQVNRRPGGALRGGDAGHVIDVRVREQDVANGELTAIGKSKQRADFVARIDQDRFACLLAGNDIAVLEERTNGLALNYHDRMILAVLDDLMFTS